MMHANDIKNILQEYATAISSFNNEQKQRMEGILHQLEKKKKYYYKLEEVLEHDLPIGELNQTHTNLGNIMKEIAELEEQLRKLFSHSKSQGDIDVPELKAKSLTRQGTVTIRPTKGKPYSQAVTRQTKNYNTYTK